jgi:hypothetical protein
MALDDSIHKRMVKMVLWSIIPEEERKLESSVIESIKESAKPKIRWIKEFFRIGVKELKKDIIKAKKRNNK